MVLKPWARYARELLTGPPAQFSPTMCRLLAKAAACGWRVLVVWCGPAGQGPVREAVRSLLPQKPDQVGPDTALPVLLSADPKGNLAQWVVDSLRLDGTGMRLELVEARLEDGRLLLVLARHDGIEHIAKSDTKAPVVFFMEVADWGAWQRVLAAAELKTHRTLVLPDNGRSRVVLAWVRARWCAELAVDRFWSSLKAVFGAAARVPAVAGLVGVAGLVVLVVLGTGGRTWSRDCRQFEITCSNGTRYCAMPGQYLEIWQHRVVSVRAPSAPVHAWAAVAQASESRRNGASGEQTKELRPIDGTADTYYFVPAHPGAHDLFFGLQRADAGHEIVRIGLRFIAVEGKRGVCELPQEREADP